MTANPPSPATSQGSSSSGGTASGGITLTQDQFDQLLWNSHSTGTVTLTKPRVGGVTSAGSWSGGGKNDLGQEPVTFQCYRAFAYEGLKSMQALSDIEEKCKAGL